MNMLNKTTSVDLRHLRQLTSEEIDAVNGGFGPLVGVAVGALAGYLGLHTAVEHYILTTEEAWYAAR